MIKTKKIAGTIPETPARDDVKDASRGLPPGSTKKGIKR
jgi:hypothetical protein